MTPEAVLSIILGTLGFLGSAGFWGYKQSRKEAPIKKRDADVAAASSVQQMAMAIADDMRTDIDRLRTDLTAEREERKKLEGRLEGVVEDLRQRDITIRLTREALQAFSYAWDALATNWQSIRQSDRPPEKPIANIH